MADDKAPPVNTTIETHQKGFTPAPGRTMANDGFTSAPAPGKVQGGYVGPTGALPAFPEGGGSVFEPAAPAPAIPSPSTPTTGADE